MSQNYYYGHGKLLLTGEYFVLDGAKSLALPTKLGQRMHVNYRPSNSPKLYWKSFDIDGKCWFETSFELWHFDCLVEETPESKILKTILQQARLQNIHFLREEVDVYVETVLEFPLNWGLGSSSTLIYNIAQWAYVSPFALQAKSFGGSGYDIACAQSMGPITYQINSAKRPHWETVSFNPVFKENLYFVYLNEKQNSRQAIERYKEIVTVKEETINRVNEITEKMLECIDIAEFSSLMAEHENIIAHELDLRRVKDDKFPDFWGEIKSLGAWGGDFVLVTSEKSAEETKQYFSRKGHGVVFSFDEFILQNFERFSEVKENDKSEDITTNAQ